MHAATRAGADDDKGREALLRYILRPPIAQERVMPGPEGLVRIALKKRFSDGTVAVDMGSYACADTCLRLAPHAMCRPDRGRRRGPALGWPWVSADSDVCWGWGEI